MTHAELFDLVAPAGHNCQCHRQISHQDDYWLPRYNKPMQRVAIKHCPACDVIIEVTYRNDHTTLLALLDRPFSLRTATFLRRARR